jgi:hypothetical protein
VRSTIGFSAGCLATITLSEINLLVGILAGLVTVLCLLPDGIMKWRKFVYDYRIWQAQNGASGLFAFAGYCFGRVSARRKDKSQLSLGLSDDGEN